VIGTQSPVVGAVPVVTTRVRVEASRGVGTPGAVGATTAGDEVVALSCTSFVIPTATITPPTASAHAPSRRASLAFRTRGLMKSI
jgi:hypothetical protein